MPNQLPPIAHERNYTPWIRHVKYVEPSVRKIRRRSLQTRNNQEKLIFQLLLSTKCKTTDFELFFTPVAYPGSIDTWTFSFFGHSKPIAPGPIVRIKAYCQPSTRMIAELSKYDLVVLHVRFCHRNDYSNSLASPEAASNLTRDRGSISKMDKRR